MFCFQCEQTASCKGCAGSAGICGKKFNIAPITTPEEDLKAILK